MGQEFSTDFTHWIDNRKVHNYMDASLSLVP